MVEEGGSRLTVNVNDLRRKANNVQDWAKRTIELEEIEPCDGRGNYHYNSKNWPYFPNATSYYERISSCSSSITKFLSYIILGH